MIQTDNLEVFDWFTVLEPQPFYFLHCVFQDCAVKKGREGKKKQLQSHLVIALGREQNPEVCLTDKCSFLTVFMCVCVPLPPWKCVLSLREVPRGRKLWWSANTHRVSHSVSDGFLADAETSTRNTAGQHIHMLPLLKTPMFVSIVLCSFKNSPDKSFLSLLSLFFFFLLPHTNTRVLLLFC